MQSAELNLGFTTILSPVEGVAGLAQAQVGNLIGPSTGPLTTVVQIEPIRVYFSVAERLLTMMQERALAEGKVLRGGTNADYRGPPLELTLSSGTVYPHQGRIRFSNNQVDLRTGTMQVVGEFPNPQRLLVPGMFSGVRVLLETQTNALVVPQRAVTDMQGSYLIAVVGAENKVSIVPVTVGERVGSEWVIPGKGQGGRPSRGRRDSEGAGRCGREPGALCGKGGRDGEDGTSGRRSNPEPRPCLMPGTRLTYG